MGQAVEQVFPQRALIALLEQHGWAELTEERFTAYQRLRYVLAARVGGRQAIARALDSGALGLSFLAAAAAPSMVDLAGRALLVIGAFVVALCTPGVLAWARRERRWRRVERSTRRGAR